MLGALNLYLDPELPYGLGINHARNICTWIHQFLCNGKLPLHQYDQYHSSILEDEDFTQEIQLHLSKVQQQEGHIQAQDIVDYVAMPKVQERLGVKAKVISKWTAQRWLHKLNWHYGQKWNGMYIDGHERPDFIQQWQEYEKRMFIYDNDGNIQYTPKGFPVAQAGRFHLILVTHDESTFYANDHCKTGWSHSSEKATPQRKGKGPSLMILDMLTSEWGQLQHASHEIILTGLFSRQEKNRDGYFSTLDLLKQVEHSIDIYKDKTNGFATGLFIPHQNWTHHKDGPCMQNGTFNSQSQEFYYCDNHSTMPAKWNLWPATGLNAQCEGFKCKLIHTDYFTSQKCYLEEYITSCGHICNFYPKFHCELNFIEQYWGTRICNMDVMERNVIECLDDVPLLQIQRYENQSVHFISAYVQGLTGGEAAWANHQYHGHCTLPPSMILKVKETLRKA
ncbi:hypothetical protein DFH29DRAFT_985417 [Suillus ampliporus]|nr:hypothetical protein DFH29DRAFT_985417 [Suillus ampliporus]